MSEGDRECQRRTREEFGLRTDQEWLEWVAEHGTDGGTMMMLPIPLADSEIEELQARNERAMSTIGAFHNARLASAAGAWLDQRAGGLVRLLLAHPGPDERAVAEQIVAEYGGVIEFVEHTTSEVDAVRALIHDEMSRRTPFGRAVTGAGDDVWANAARVTLRGDLHPTLPDGIRAAVTAGTLIIDHPAEPLGWDPDQQPALRHPTTEDTLEDTLEDELAPQWPGEDPSDPWAQLERCVGYVAERCVGGPLEDAQRLAEDIGLSVRVIYPGSGMTLDLRSNRINLYVNAEHVVRRVNAG